MKRAFLVSLGVLAPATLALLLMLAMFEPIPGHVDLRAAVAANLAQSGVSHPVTAVLLNFRGYDTLLEIGVLLLALVVNLAIGVQPPAAASSPPNALPQALARAAVPLVILVAVYLLWAGAFRPGGAFQAAAVLAAGAVLLNLTGVVAGWQAPGWRLRLGFVAGFAVFLAVAALTAIQGGLLQLPPAEAGTIILLIEAALTLSLALVLAGLFLFVSRDPGEAR